MTHSLRYIQLGASIALAFVFVLTASGEATAQRGRARKPAAAPQKPPVATINGQPIPYHAYREALDDHMRFQRRAGTMTGVDDLVADTILLGLVDDELVRQEAARRRLVVDREAAIRMLLKDPPDFMRAPFKDSRGEFRRDVFEMVVRDPSQIVRLLEANVERDSLVRQWRADLDKVIVYMQARENRRRVMDALEAEKKITSDEIRHRYFTEKTRVIGSFLRVLHSSVPDSTLPISEAEARAWYNAHKEDYFAAPARMIGVAVLPIEPTPADSAVQRTRLDSIRRAVAAASPGDRSRVVKEIQRTLPVNRFGDDPIRPTQLTNDMLKQIVNTPDGGIVGPFAQEGESVLLYLERRVPGRDTVVRARHLVLRSVPGDTASDRDTRALIAALADSINDEQEFIEGVKYFSTDGSIETQGDLGYFGRGRMAHAFDSAAFSAPLGKVIGPVHTEFGYHLIWVNERVTDGYVLRELRVPLSVSPDARAAVTRDADMLAAAMRTGDGTADSLVRAFRMRYPMMATDTTYIKRLERYGDVLAPARFAFGAKVGDVAVLPLPLNRLMVVRLNAVWSGGIPEYENIPQFPEAHARRAKQLDVLAPRMREIASKITPEMLIGPLRDLAPMAEVFLLNDRVVNAPPDEHETILDSLVANVPRQSVGGPVRGTHGFYFLRVLEKNGPTESQFLRDRETFAAEYRQRRRNEMLATLIGQLRARSTFEDHRDVSQ